MTTKRISKSVKYSLVSAGLAWCMMNGSSHLVHASGAIRQAVPISPYGENSGVFSDEPFYIDYTITAPEEWVYGSPDQDGYPFPSNQDTEDPFWYLQNGNNGIDHPGLSPANDKLLIVGGYCDSSTAADLCTIHNGENYEGGFSKGYIEYRFTEPGTLTMHIQVQTADTAVMSPDDTVCSEMASGYIATACLTYVMGMTGGGSPTVAPTTSVTPSSTPVPMCTPNQTSPPVFAQKIGRQILTNSHPTDVAVDSEGNTYVVESENNRIMKFDPAGNYLTQWGTQGFGDGEFQNPRGITTDASGDVYVADTHNYRIQKFTSSGTFVSKWGSYGSGDGEFSLPYGITTDSSGNVYVADTLNHRIQTFTSSGVFVSKWGSQGSEDGQFSYPYSITTDSSGNIYVADTSNRRIQTFTSLGVFVSKWGSLGSGDGEFANPQGITADSSGNIFVADTDNRRIQKFTFNPNISDYRHSLSFGSLGSGNGQLDHPNDIAVDTSGYIYVVDTNNRRIQKFDKDGLYVLQWGSNGSGDGQFNNPMGIAIDSLDSVYIVDQELKRVQKFSTTGQYILKWGSWGAGNYQFYDPEYITVDDANNVYVSDSNARQVKKYNTSGTYVTRWGTLGGGTGDGQFNVNSGLVTDGTSYIYITDGNSGVSGGRIQKFTLDGNFVSKWGSGFLTQPIAVSYFFPDKIFVLNMNANTIVQYDTSGNLVNSWGSYGSQNGQLNSARGLTTDVSGNVLVADTNNNRIQVFSVAGGYEYTSQWSTDGHPGAGIFTTPYGVATDQFDNIYVVDTENRRIQKFDSSGNYLTQWGTQGSGDGQFDYPYGITTDSSGKVYVVDTYNHRIQKFDSSGNFLGKWGSEGSGNGQFSYPQGITIDPSGDVYVADTSNSRIQKFDSLGNYVSKWGSSGMGNGQFVNPSGITIDSTGKIYVVDSSNHRIQNFDSSGNFLTKWPRQGSGNGQVTNPQGIAVNTSGDVLVADASNNRIQRFTYSKITTVPPEGGYSLIEGGSTKSYSLVLNAVPTKNTTIFLTVESPASGSSVSTIPSTLTFTPRNWSTPQTVTISPNNDDIRTGDRVASIRYIITSDDNVFNCVPLADTTIQIAEDDVAAPSPSLTVTPTQAPTHTPQPAPTLPPEIQKRPDEGFDANGECIMQRPGGRPDIFRIDMTDTKATLYIAPPSKPYTQFYITYKEVGSVTLRNDSSPGSMLLALSNMFERPVYADSPEYAIDFSHVDDGGVVVYTINDLKPDTKYEFTIKCANKCAFSETGNTLGVATSTRGSLAKTYLASNTHRDAGLSYTSLSHVLVDTGSPAGISMVAGITLLMFGVGVYVAKPRDPLDNTYSLTRPRKLRIKKR